MAILKSGFIGSVGLAAAFSVAGVAIAQTYPTCQPPSASEYLLMVVHQSPEVDEQLQGTLPRNATTTVCTYLGTVVTRVGGFDNLEVANSWAQYLNDMGGLQAFVARPPTSPQAASQPELSPNGAAAPSAAGTPLDDPPPSQAANDLVEPFPTPSQLAPNTASLPVSPSVTPDAGAIAAQPSPTSMRSYNPQPLGAGYAVLVDYANRPEVAADVQQVINSQVGLAVYNQRPYLLANYTIDPAIAANVLRMLGDRNFSAMIVDSRQTILLIPAVIAE